MTIEANVVTVRDLDDTLPAKSDYISEGDDHVRLIKHTLQQTFPEADAPLTSPLSELSKVTDYMEFKEDTNGSYNIIEFKELTQVKNAGNATDDKDLVTLGQLKTVITGLLTQRLYKKGSYFITEENNRPEIILDMPGTSWTKVSGFLAGDGVIGNNVIVTAGQNGGSSKVRLTEANLPRAAVDFSQAYIGTQGSEHTHTYTTAIRQDGVTNEFHTGEGRNDHHTVTQNTGSAGSAHTHNFGGTAYIGHDDNSIQDVTTVPFHRGVYIWRRDS